MIKLRQTVEKKWYRGYHGSEEFTPTNCFTLITYIHLSFHYSHYLLCVVAFSLFLANYITEVHLDLPLRASNLDMFKEVKEVVGHGRDGLVSGSWIVRFGREDFKQRGRCVNFSLENCRNNTRAGNLHVGGRLVVGSLDVLGEAVTQERVVKR